MSTKKRLELIKLDKELFLEWLEDISRDYRDRELDDYCKEYSLPEVEIPSDEEGYLREIENAYRDCDPDKTEVLLKSIPDSLKGSRRYTQQAVRLLRELKGDIDAKKGWQPVKADVLQLLFIHSPHDNVRRTGLEILVSNKIGSETSDDISYKICSEIGGCRFVFTSYLNAQDAEGYLDRSQTCPVHSDILYTEDERQTLWKRLDESTSSL